MLSSVGPVAEGQDDFERLAADYDDIDAGVEFVEAVRLVAARIEEIELVVGPGKEAVNANAAED